MEPQAGSSAMEYRPSLAYALQVPAWVLLLSGIALFFGGYYYLSTNIVKVILSQIPVVRFIAITLTLYLTGYILILVGSLRWFRLFPRWGGSMILSVVIVVPLVMVATWFDAAGNRLMLLFILIVGLVIPAIAAILWRFRLHYELTSTEVRGAPGSSGGWQSSMALQRVHSVAVFESVGPFDTGHVQFHTDLFRPASEGDTGASWIEWRGIAHPRQVAESIKARVPLAEGTYRRAVRPWTTFAATFALVAVVVLLLEAFPVYAASDAMVSNCALWVSAQSIESNPWPYVHNVTIPIGRVSLHWWSGTPVWFLLIQIPTGIAYQNTPISSLYPGNQANLTESGSGTFTSAGGSTMALCVATTTGASVSLVLNYSAPLVWE